MRDNVFYVGVRDDYRNGPYVTYYSEDDEALYDSEGDLRDDVLEVSKITLSLPDEKKYIAHIILDLSEEKIISKEFKHISNAKKYLVQFYVRVNDCGPFVVTSSIGYKDNGYYGTKIPITYKSIRNFDMGKIDPFGIIIGIVMNDKGKIVNTLSITPGE